MTTQTSADRSPSFVQTMLARWRYIKFGLVGASGTVVNLVVLLGTNLLLYCLSLLLKLLLLNL